MIRLQDGSIETLLETLLTPRPPEDHPRDTSRSRLKKEAELVRADKRYPNQVIVFYKYSCEHCGWRNAHPEPNVLPETSICRHCHKVSKIEKGGFSFLAMDTDLNLVVQNIVQAIKERDEKSRQREEGN